MRFKYALFDLDGTLSESAPGITKSVQYALAALGIDEPDIDNLKSFVGPPLNVEFKRRYGLSDEEIVFAVDKYRERYAVTGLYECEMYPGIPDMLKACADEGIILAVASSKPELFVKQIIEYFGLTKFFAVIVGAAMNEEKNRAGVDQKSFIVQDALSRLKAAGALKADISDEEFRSSCAMVGDRLFDINGAKANRVTSVGVTFGYGSREELEEAGADFIACDAGELTDILCKDR